MHCFAWHMGWRALLTAHGHAGAPGMSSAEQLTWKTTGVIVHGYGYFLYALEPHLPGNANSNMFCFHKTIMHMFSRLNDPNDQEVTIWPRMLTLQVDGASDNKCRAMFAYCEWLILIGAFEEILVSFLIVGHTHADYDQKFIKITKAMRKSVVKSMDDLLELFKTCYGPKNKPRVVEAVRAVPDFTKWLVQDAGVEVSGFARRVPDVHRPHRFMLSRSNSAPMPGATYACETDYKQHSSDPDSEIMNMVDGERQPVQWLSSMPNEAGPPMQPVKTGLVDALRASKPNVYRNFEPSGLAAGMFQAEDIKWYDDFYAMCSTNASLTTAMQAAYHWQQPGARHTDAPGVELQFERLHRAPPICHSSYTEAERKRMIREEMEENKEANAAIDKAVAEYMEGKDHGRGYRALSKQSKERVAAMERDLIARSLNLARKPGAAKKDVQAEAAEQDVSYECNIVGASKSEDIHGNKYEMLYLVQFPGYEGADDAVRWLPASHLSESAIESALEALDGQEATGPCAHRHMHRARIGIDMDCLLQCIGQRWTMTNARPPHTQAQ